MSGRGKSTTRHHVAQEWTVVRTQTPWIGMRRSIQQLPFTAQLTVTYTAATFHWALYEALNQVGLYLSCLSCPILYLFRPYHSLFLSASLCLSLCLSLSF